MELVRLDNDLNSAWNIMLSGGQSNYAYGQCLKSLQNGNVAIAFFTTYGNSGDHFHLYIIHDSYDSTAEMAADERPFTLYPSPVKDILSLNFADGNEPEYVELYDLQGHLVNTIQNGWENIDMGIMPAGVYTLRVTMKNGTSYYEKIVKQ